MQKNDLKKIAFFLDHQFKSISPGIYKCLCAKKWRKRRPGYFFLIFRWPCLKPSPDYNTYVGFEPRNYTYKYLTTRTFNILIYTHTHVVNVKIYRRVRLETGLGASDRARARLQLVITISNIGRLSAKYAWHSALYYW